MGWFSKKDKIPELPAPPRLPDFPKSNNMEALPELPGTKNNNSNQEMIKYAMADSGEKEVSQMLPKDLKIEEELIPSVQHEEENRLERMAMRPSMSDPVFVRIDKFQEAHKNLEEIKRGLKDIENTLKKVKDVKQKEDLEISAWTQEIANV
jgi:hypothetical protein